MSDEWTREKAAEIARQVIVKSITETDHASLKSGDLVFCLASEKCLKITAVDEHFATVSDNEREYSIPITDLASNEAVRINTALALYSDRVITVILQKEQPE